MAKSKKNQPKPFKRSAITLAEFRSRHFHDMSFSTDMYYVGFANTIYPIIKKMIGRSERYGDAVIRELVLNLTGYLEDLVSRAGVWEAFVSLHKKKYGRELPFYDTDDEFYSREFPCHQAVSFLIWSTFNANSPDTILNPKNPFMSMLSLALLPYMIDAYDDAPDTFGRAELMPEEKLGVPLFYQIRDLCFWLCKSCYLTRVRDFDSISGGLDVLETKFFDAVNSSSSYLREAFIPFNAKIGPLGITAQEWLAEILEISHGEGEEQYIPIIKELRSLPYSIYAYKEVQKNGGILKALDGSEIELSAYTMANAEIPSVVKTDDSAIMSLVYFDGRWMMNGLAAQGISPACYNNARENWIENDEFRKRSFAASLKLFKKKRIGVCAGYEAYLDMYPCIDRKKFRNVPDNIRNCDNLLYYLNDDSLVTLLPGWGSCVKIRGNKLYNKKEAEEDAHSLIFDHDLTTREMRTYLVDNNLIPDAALKSVESMKAGKKLFQDNIRFLSDYTDRDTMEVFSKDMILADKRINETDA